MPSVCLFFKVHQPFRLKGYTSNEVEVSHCYEDSGEDEAAINKLADQCYLPANEIILSLIDKYENFRVNYSISGITLELLKRYRPDVIDSFKSLVLTGRVELTGETYYHSLSSLHSKNEFERQVVKHADLVKALFNVKPSFFRNTELIYNNELAKQLTAMGFKGILCDGVSRILNGRSANHVYAAPGTDSFGLLLRNTSLSDDISFRFDDRQWNEYPLTAEKFAEWICMNPENDEVVNLFMDYETFGIHKTKETGIFDFLNALPGHILNDERFSFDTASDVLKKYQPVNLYDSPQTVSWENKERECFVWCQNVMQNNSLKKIYSIENLVLSEGAEDKLDAWGRLQTADYFFYMAGENNGEEVYRYQNPFEKPKDAFQHYTNMITDFEISLIRKTIEKAKKKFSFSSKLFMMV